MPARFACRRTTPAAVLARVRKRLPPLRRAEARVLRDRLQGDGRLVLGAPELADAAPRSRLRPLASGAARLGAARLALDRAARAARGAHRLGLRWPLPRPLRPADLPRQARLRLPHDAVRGPARRLRAPALPRHVQLEVRAGLAARELLRRPQPDRDVLLRLLPVRPHERRL